MKSVTARPQRLGLILLAAYPLLLLAALWLQRSWISALAALDLISLLLLGGLLRGNRMIWTLWLGAVAGTFVLSVRGQAEIVLLLVPVAINAGMAWFFGRTLGTGRRPLVTRAILAFEGEQRLAQPGVSRYARSLTWAWTLLLAAQAVLMLLCAACALPNGILPRLGVAPPLAIPGGLANWYLHLGGFVVIGVFSVLEFAWRNWHLRHLPHENPRRYFATVVRNWRRVLHDETPGA
ncbi:xanthomonadin biosynthesis protein [Tahibacter harae]|uniref:Xanthomonadin biosynthesis protein n=1 Tax=Tahibacter harae TaxID=2963937 RepID=A0ABT1QPQ1_9GAMM|nr:xanthomonadin biosynthesis protein [Tahibacter harae]MCQ4164252.1 xanthomonadin biosynthesis protein [Tahibacter harae]